MAIVLIVENDEHQRILYEQELTDEGYVVWLAEDGWKAIDIVRERRPDVVVLDLHMPGMDGLDTLSRLLDVDRTLPIIIYTAFTCYKDSFMSWTADDYLVKSSDLTPLKATIRRVLDQRVIQNFWGKEKGGTLRGTQDSSGFSQTDASEAQGQVFI